MKDLFSILGATIIVIIGIDFVGFIAWAMSGQIPPDSMFIGAITKSILSLIIG